MLISALDKSETTAISAWSMTSSLFIEEIPRWARFTAISSLLCIAGSLCVPAIAALSRNKSGVNSRLLNYGLSVSAGSMITTSLYKMLPRGEDDKRVVFVGFFAGAVVSFLLNFVVHAYTSESLVHCGHASDNGEGSGAENVQDHARRHSEHEHNSEAEPLTSSARPALRNARSIIDLISKKDPNSGDCYGSMSCAPAGQTPSGQAEVTCQADNTTKAVVCPENGIGYDLENLALYREHFMKGNSHKHSHSSGSDSSNSSPNASVHSSEHHHHHLATPFSKLLSIGIQTCLVITLHKFPEGFIVFFTNNNDSDSKSFGFSIFLSLAMHNFIEGFAMTLPLYAAFRTKWYAILTASVLGGGSQPLGALIGYFIFKNTGAKELHINLLLSITSGFLFVIGLMMFQTAVGFSDSHHHHNDQGRSPDETHSLATVCLKWCCFGVLLILGSGLFA